MTSPIFQLKRKHCEASLRAAASQSVVTDTQRGFESDPIPFNLVLGDLSDVLVKQFTVHCLFSDALIPTMHLLWLTSLISIFPTRYIYRLFVRLLPRLWPTGDGCTTGVGSSDEGDGNLSAESAENLTTCGACSYHSNAAAIWTTSGAYPLGYAPLGSFTSCLWLRLAPSRRSPQNELCCVRGARPIAFCFEESTVLFVSLQSRVVNALQHMV